MHRRGRRCSACTGSRCTRPGATIADFIQGRVTAGDAAGRAGLRKVIDGVADGMLCHRGWTVATLDPKRRTIATLAHGAPQPGINGVSAAAIAQGELWLGSYQSARLARVVGWHKLARQKGRQ